MLPPPVFLNRLQMAFTRALLFPHQVAEKSDECLTDEEKLNRYRLGEVHFGVQYDIPNSTLIVRMLEARDLPLPLNHVSRVSGSSCLQRMRVCLGLGHDHQCRSEFLFWQNETFKGVNDECDTA